jgi:hypothetical protein
MSISSCMGRDCSRHVVMKDYLMGYRYFKPKRLYHLLFLRLVVSALVNSKDVFMSNYGYRTSYLVTVCPEDFSVILGCLGRRDVSGKAATL